MRWTLAVLGPNTTRLACYVDDPVATLSGPPAYQSRQVAHLIFLWCALGLPLAFHKGQWGNQVTWISAMMSISQDALLVEIKADLL
eukprot:1023133-Amphidinium_carterae.1